ncbi:MAG: T9SS type A sorting domain-containing protein, partial [Algibacter sp.]
QNFTFTPTGGSNSSVVVAMAGGAAPATPVNLNWINVTSFTVTTTAPATAQMAFDDLIVSVSTLSISANNIQKTLIYPNPVENILTIKNVSDIISVDIYNNLGQRVLQSKQNSIDMGHLTKGLYFLQIRTALGTETKRIIKK